VLAYSRPEASGFRIDERSLRVFALVLVRAADWMGEMFLQKNKTAEAMESINVNMAAQDLIDRVAKVAKPYFPEFSQDRFRELTDQLPPEEPAFAQISQFENQLQLEVGFRSGRLLVDLTFRGQSWIETLIPIDNIQQLSFNRTTAASLARFHESLSSVVPSRAGQH